ncbi:MAG TPA: Glu/Leu/Phe/Val dehydrogenase family protein, partial [Bacillales bacterium]|nr:Glu/Leu/Phe/Val dehydrogenase family protein [Bacillales bacterium]
KVGSKVAKQLLDEGAHLYVSDISREAIDRVKTYAETTQGTVVVLEGDAIYGADADVFVPCALGGVINDESIERLRVKAVAGSANNQLLDEVHGDKLREKGILYAPDYIVNSGGLIQVADELHPHGPSKERVMRKTRAIYDTLISIFRTAESHGISTSAAADHFVEERIATRMKRNSFFTHHQRPKWNLRN